jgi:hypothetical protein
VIGIFKDRQQEIRGNKGSETFNAVFTASATSISFRILLSKVSAPYLM